MVITFYVDEIMPISQTAKLKSVKGESATYDLGEIEEVPRRFVTASVRVDPEHAASLATLIAEKCYGIRPDLFPDVGSPASNGSKKK